MNEISFQAVQFFPRFTSVIILLAVAWLVAKFAQYTVLRAATQCHSSQNTQKIAKIVSRISFWIVMLLISPFILRAAGLNTAWLWKMQELEIQFFVNWPIWMIVSLLVAAISYLVFGIPKFYLQFKGAFNASKKELPS